MMAEDILSILNGFRGMVFKDEDGHSLNLSLNDPASEEQLQQCENMLKSPLPAALKALLRASNGLGLFGCEIMSVAALIYYPDQDVLAFHSWANGDFDCIATRGSQWAEGSVLFMNHSPDVLVGVEESLSEWLVRVVGEIREKGALLHPSDYRNRDDMGVYGQVLDKLRGVDCELNR